MGQKLSLLKRLTASSQHLDAAVLRDEAAQLPCQELDRVCRGEATTVYGKVTAVRYNPTANVPLLEAELFDGSGTLQLVWLGRRRIPGIEPGRKLMARGRVGKHGDRLAIYNPWYQLQ